MVHQYMGFMRRRWGRFVGSATAVVFYGWQTIVVARACLAAPAPGWWLILPAYNGILVIAFLIRRAEHEFALDPPAWLVAFAGTLVPTLLRSTGSASPEAVNAGLGLIFSGLFIDLLGILSLGRSFGIVAANRGVQARGLYRLVRHPMYAGGLLFMLGFVIANPSPRNGSLFVVEAALQLVRIRFEERLLNADPGYRRYSQRVRFRLVPGIV